jgi:hypothetical protein
LVGFATTNFTPGAGADIVMESITLSMACAGHLSEMAWLRKLSNKKALAAKPDKRIEQKRKFRLRHPPVVRS